MIVASTGRASASEMLTLRGDGLMKNNMRRCSRRVAVFGMCSLALAACNRQSGSARTDSTSAAGDITHSPDTVAAATMVRGTVATLSQSDVGIKTDSTTVAVQLNQPGQ